ncbi:MAG: hypothetical protein C5S52_08810 [ANME-2 cluster archaeon]|nr:hypothetical protein [ANME-2 cluster archaeon]
MTCEAERVVTRSHHRHREYIVVYPAVSVTCRAVHPVIDICILRIHKDIAKLVSSTEVAVGAVAGIAAVDHYVINSRFPVVRDLCRLTIDDVTVWQYHL